MAKNTMVLGTSGAAKTSKSDKPVLTGPLLHATKDLEDIKESDPLSSDAIQVKYLRLWANDDGSGDDIDLPTDKLLEIVHSEPADDNASWERRATKARDAHNKAHPIEDQSMSIPQNMKQLSAEADDELGEVLEEFSEAAKKTKYGALIVMNALEKCYESSIDLWPLPDNDTEEGKPKENKSYKWNKVGIPAYDKGYREKPKGEKGIPSFYADWFDGLPDLGGHRMGQTITAEITALDKVQSKMNPHDYADQVANLRDERTKKISLCKRAMKLRFKLRSIGPIVMQEVEVTVNGKVTKQKVRAKLEGLENVGFVIRIDPRNGKILRTKDPIALQDVGTPDPQTRYKSVGQILAMTPEALPINCTLQQLLDSGGTGTNDSEDDDDTSSVFKSEDIEKVVTPILMRVEASLQETTFASALQRHFRMKDKKTKRYMNMPLVDTCKSILNALLSLEPTLDEVKAEDDKIEIRRLAEQRKREQALAKAHDVA